MMVGLGVLSLLAEAAADNPLVCVIDDAHWLDRASAQALAFAARRAGSLPVLVIFAAREPATHLSGLPEMAIGRFAIPTPAACSPPRCRARWMKR